MLSSQHGVDAENMGLSLVCSGPEEARVPAGLQRLSYLVSRFQLLQGSMASLFPPCCLPTTNLPTASLQLPEAFVLFWVSTLLSPPLPQSHPAPALGVASLSPLPPALGVTRVSRGPGGYTLEQSSSSAWSLPWCLLRFKHTPESCIWGCST